MRQVQGTINGYGERCGNANLVTIWANLGLKLELRRAGRDEASMGRLAELSHFVAEVANIVPDDHRRTSATSAFAHKGGVHGAATARVEHAYQHIDPRGSATARRLVVSELGGRGNTQWGAEALGHPLEGRRPRAALSQLIKRWKPRLPVRGGEGVIRAARPPRRPGYQPPFELAGLQWWSSSARGGTVPPRRSVKVEVDGEVLHTAAEGNGPVNALDPRCARRCRILPGVDRITWSTTRCASWRRCRHGRATRVLIESSNANGDLVDGRLGFQRHRRIGPGPDRLVEFGLWKSGADLVRRDRESEFTTLLPDERVIWRERPGTPARRRYRLMNSDARREGAGTRKLGPGWRREAAGNRGLGLLRQPGGAPSPTRTSASPPTPSITGPPSSRGSGPTPRRRHAAVLFAARALRPDAAQRPPARGRGARPATSWSRSPSSCCGATARWRTCTSARSSTSRRIRSACQLSDLDDRLAIFTFPLGDYVATDGLRVSVSAWQRVSDNAVPARAKITGSYVNACMAVEDARRRLRGGVLSPPMGTYARRHRIALGQRRSLVGQVRLGTDQDQPAVIALLAQRLDGLAASQSRADDRVRVLSSHLRPRFNSRTGCPISRT